MTEMSKKDLKEMFFEMEKETGALIAKKKKRIAKQMATKRETIRERNAYFMDKYWISLGNSTLQNDFLSRFVRKFRRRLYEQIELRSIGVALPTKEMKSVNFCNVILLYFLKCIRRSVKN